MSTAKKTAPAATPVDSVVAAGKDTVEKMTKVTQETAQKNFDKAIGMTKENVDKASEAVMKGYDEATKLAQGNYDAMSKSFDIATKGFEDVSKAGCFHPGFHRRHCLVQQGRDGCQDRQRDGRLAEHLRQDPF